jgi:hypothetical protein
VLEASIQAYKNEAASARTQGLADLQKANDSLTSALAQLDQEKAAHKKAVDAKTNQEGLFADKQKDFDKIKVESEKAHKEVDVLIKQKTDLQTRLDGQIDLTNKLRDLKVAADITANDYKTRLGNLEKQYVELNNQYTAMKKKGVTVTTVASNPPPADVEGLVKKSDPNTNLVTISIGSDDGLAKGHTLEVFRLEPQAKYLGTIKILEVRPHEAVGVRVSKKAGDILKDDHVAAKILGGG